MSESLSENKALIKKMAEVYKTGKSLRFIAEKTKMSHEQVRILLEPTGVLRKKGNPIDPDKAKKMFEKCDTYQELADKLDIDVGYAYRLIHGYEPTGNREKKTKGQKQTRKRPVERKRSVAKTVVRQRPGEVVRQRPII